MNKADLLIELQTEELPPKALLKLAQAFNAQISERLQKANVAFKDSQFFATPRRLAVLVTDLAESAPEQVVERKGPARQAAFDASGKPTPACEGFARSCGVSPSELQVTKTAQGEWMSYTQTISGKSIKELLPDIVEQAALALPIPKRMRWGAGQAEFVRPVHRVILLYGDQVIPATILGCETGRVTVGHRFLAPEKLHIEKPSDYASTLEKQGFVLADFAKRRALIREQAIACVQKSLGADAEVFISSDALLDEVTGLVEWPVALCGQFAKEFLTVPSEVLISAMQDHQRYFPVVDKNGKLLANFITMSNIDSQNKQQVIHGNERVLRARLSDAAFFYNEDKKQRLEQRLERLKGIVFQAKLRTMHDKAMRIGALAETIANQLNLDAKQAARAGQLAKADLTSHMVNEFPELQGTMGGYYAKHDGEAESVSAAVAEHYQPRFAGDRLPVSPLGNVVAIADRLDTLIGAFGISQIPTGDKDPYGLRRAALGVLRILIENRINLDLHAVLAAAANQYQPALPNKEAVAQVLTFMQERLRAYYQDQGVTLDVFAAVAEVGIVNPLDADARIKAVQAFKKLTAAEALSVANKRVSNILAKADTIAAKTIDPAFFENSEEKELARQLEMTDEVVAQLFAQGKYDEALLKLAELRQPIDDFFDHVMVMTDDKAKRENRLLLLGKLRALFLQVADIALLQ